MVDIVDIVDSGVQCETFEPMSAGSRACRYYMRADGDAGMCALPTEFLCTEWVRRRGTAGQVVQLLARRESRGSRDPAATDADDPLS